FSPIRLYIKHEIIFPLFNPTVTIPSFGFLTIRSSPILSNLVHIIQSNPILCTKQGPITLCPS
ncbi:hypothetical protein PanWU01x14_228810, partial [Parasponia andersonii]